MSFRLALFTPLAAILLPGCLARAAVDVVTLPVKVASKGVDLATTSQSEADQKRGREIRQREEKFGKLQREYDKAQGQCFEGDQRACRKQVEIRGQMAAIMPTVPYEPR